MTELTILGLDPGFENLGYAVLTLYKSPDSTIRETLRAAGLICTKKSAKKKAILAAEDNHRRVREQREALVRVLDQYRPTVIATESSAFIKNSAVMFRLGLTNGMVIGLVEERRLVLSQLSTTDVKVAVVGAKAVSKDEVAAAVDARFGGSLAARFFPDLAGKPDDRSHPYDAAAVALAAGKLDALRLYLHC